MSGETLHINESLSGRFLKIANAFPDRHALYVNEKYYSYGALMKMVEQIRSAIPVDKMYSSIGIYCNNDVYTYASLLAVNLYGAAYVPLNNKFPVARNKKIVAECLPELILSSSENNDLKEIADGGTIVYTDLTQNKNAVADEKKTTNIVQDNCYILFTSGTSGEPKGVPVSNENVRHFFNYFLKEYDFNERDKFLQVYELTFDVSVFSFFMPLLVGACCYILPDDGVKPVKIAEWLKKYEISILSMVPGVLKYLENYLPEIRLPHLRYSFFSGDALLHHLAVKWSRSLPAGAIHNFYGPTETTIVCTRYVFNEERSATESVNGIVPLGKAFAGMEFLILDEENKPVAKGEICFSGVQVIAGYLDKNENKFFLYQGKRYYKTGDLASLNKNGNLVFHGRNDSQVKINGYRVELGEIEYAISKITGADCVVLYRKNELSACIETTQPDEKKLITELHKILPAYMIPKRFIGIEKFGLNVNGKVDRKALINSYL